MGAVASVIEDTFQAVGDAVGAVEGAIEDAASAVGHAVEDIAKQVGKTVEAIAKDPAKAIALVAVAVVAPELAPLLWEGATAAEAAMVLNTGLQIAQGADPMAIAQNLATSMVTQGLTSNLDVSTGSFMADKALANAASAAIQGGDVNKAIGSSIGGSLIGMGTGAMSNELRNFDYKGMYDDAVANDRMSDANAQVLVQGRIFQDAVNAGIDAEQAVELAKNFDPNAQEYKALETAPASEQEILNAKIFKDAIDAGFTQEEAAAIAKGTIEGQDPTVSNPIAGASVTVEGAPTSDAQETTTPVIYKSISREDLDNELKDGEITQEQYDSLLPYAAPVSKSEQEYVDPETIKAPQEYVDPRAATEDTTSPIDATKEPAVPYNALNETTNDQGQKVYTYDDGSTLTVGADGEVVDVTEATDTGEYVEEEDPNSPSGFKLKFPRVSGAGAARSRIAPKSISRSTKSSTVSGGSTSPTSSTGGLDSLGGEAYGVGLTANVARGNPEYELMGAGPSEEEVPAFATGGSSTQGVYDLSSTVSSPFLGGGNADIMALKPGLIKGKSNYVLPGFPYGEQWRAAKTGGHMVDDHNPSFFSEGGLSSMKNTYVKGEGDGTSDSIKAMLANGEFVIPADVVSNLGNGSNDAGAKVLDEFLKTIRAHKRKADPKGLPPDSKGALSYLATAKKKVKK